MKNDDAADPHDWKPVEDKCEEQCSLCGTTREVHDWNELCACRRCRKKNDKKIWLINHEWKPVVGKCAEKCSFCGEMQEARHDWQPIEDECAEKCSFCGKMREAHIWETVYHYVDLGGDDSYCNVSSKCKKCNKTGDAAGIID
ncbi:hypothetical protein [Methanolapillus africanus]